MKSDTYVCSIETTRRNQRRNFHRWFDFRLKMTCELWKMFEESIALHDYVFWISYICMGNALPYSVLSWINLCNSRKFSSSIEESDNVINVDLRYLIWFTIVRDLFGKYLSLHCDEKQNWFWSVPMIFLSSYFLLEDGIFLAFLLFSETLLVFSYWNTLRLLRRVSFYLSPDVEHSPINEIFNFGNS